MTETKTATERLREMLDARGEGYVCDEYTVTWSYYTDPHSATESIDGTLIVTGLTPEQAIAATLGSVECVPAELDYIEDKSRWYELFGTPERAAQLITDNCEYLDYCGQCWIRAANCDGEYLTVLEWLRGDAE